MNRVSFLNGLLIGGLTLTGLASCTQPGEALRDRQRRENDAEIAQYIATNNLTGRAQTTEAGTYYIVTTSLPSAQTAAAGDEIQYHYVARRFDGLIVDSTDIAANLPRSFTRGFFSQNIVTAGIYDGIVNSGPIRSGIERVGMREGEKATLLVPSYLDGGRVGSLLLPQFSPVRYDITVAKVRTEDEQIDDFIALNKYTVTTKTTEGVRIVKTLARPDSAQVKVGQTANVRYTGKLLNGRTFDLNTTTGFDYKVGEQQSVIGAWKIAVPLARVGEKFFLITPSSQAYGQAGDAGSQTYKVPIPPFAPLFFEMEIVSSK